MGITARVLDGEDTDEIAETVGTPLLIDNVTTNRLYDHYAQILLDLDLSKNIFYEVMVEQEGYAFPVAI